MQVKWGCLVQKEGIFSLGFFFIYRSILLTRAISASACGRWCTAPVARPPLTRDQQGKIDASPSPYTPHLPSFPFGMTALVCRLQTVPLYSLENTKHLPAIQLLAPFVLYFLSLLFGRRACPPRGEVLFGTWYLSSQTNRRGWEAPFSWETPWATWTRWNVF